MKKLALVFAVVISAAVFASQNQKSTEMIQLYFSINQSKSPFNDHTLRSKIAQVMSQTCMNANMKAINNNQQLSTKTKLEAIKLLSDKCHCFASNDTMQKGLIQSALLFNKKGENSTTAAGIMLKAADAARSACTVKDGPK